MSGGKDLSVTMVYYLVFFGFTLH